MAIPIQEKRRFPRIELKTPLHFQVRGTPDSINTVTDDISEGGLGFINNGFIAPQTSVALEISILSRILHPFGRIAWSQPIAHTDRYRVGIEFLEIDQKDKSFLSDFINLRNTQINN